ALVAAAKSVELQAMDCTINGVAVIVGVLSGGARPNVVPERCEMEVDVRAWDATTLTAATAQIRSILERTQVDGVTTDVHVNIDYPPMEPHPATERLVGLARELARDLGLELHAASTGGGSDANVVSSLGTPVLDGL